MVERELSETTSDALQTRMIAKRALRYGLLGKGHRLRAILFLSLIEAANASSTRYLKMAAAIEAIHIGTLIIDDLPCVDNASLRRGKPCCHIRFGTDVALYSSHLAFDLADRLLLLSAPLGLTTCILSDVKMLKETLIAGQCLERDLRSGVLPPTMKNLSKQYYLKSGAFFSFISTMAGRLIGLEKDDLQRLGMFGEHTGMAYQIADDLADIEGSVSKIGKMINMDSNTSNYPRTFGKDFAIKKLDEHRRRAMLSLESLFVDERLKRNREFLHLVVAEILKEDE